MVILDFNLASQTDDELDDRDRKDFKEILRRGSSWRGEIDDRLSKKLADVFTSQMKTYLTLNAHPDTRLILSRRNLIDEYMRRSSLRLVMTPVAMNRGCHLYRRIRQGGALSLMTHHGIYIGEGNVIHYSGNETALNSLLLPDQKTTKLKKSSIYCFASGQQEMRVRQYVRMPCEHGSLNVCPLRVCLHHKPIESGDLNDLVYKKRHILTSELNSAEPAWYTIGDCFENAATRAEYAYKMFHYNRQQVHDEKDGAQETNLEAESQSEWESAEQISPDEEEEDCPKLPSVESIDTDKIRQTFDEEIPIVYSFPAYNLFRSNCEHFATWCSTGWGFSLQVSGWQAGLHGAFRGLKHPAHHH